ncbi:hypothetical protein J4460_07805 [Candidatus Woesearchaeota archaeon]|nr:MAG: hypothetical protein QS99_C0011G0040 [archaeon GW2011_AR4]MBS3130543.1 hypothetical protein [Candidatus Woesearchaeota archaeon]HIH38023.1 hypothetical protein [Candidatus Woesearchaeota archaeon]HIH48380.1 hypothetical protein [Candidatus Woesearchaeota archaeon]HIJ02992.1 hypothetical protein [Candidatus Woesearchaeota archaeon]
MTDKKIISYIKSQVKQGYSLESIKQALRDQGWPEATITLSLHEAVGRSEPHLSKAIIYTGITAILLIAIASGIMIMNRPKTEIIPPPVEKAPEPQYTAPVEMSAQDNELTFSDDEVKSITAGVVVEEASFFISSFSFAESIDAFYNYKAKSTTTFYHGDDAHIYIEVQGLEQVQEDGLYHFGIVEDVTTTGPDGSLFPDLSANSIIDKEYAMESEIFFLPFRNDFAIDNDYPVGQYTIEITVKDKLSGKTARKKVNFTVAGGAV